MVIYGIWVWFVSQVDWLIAASQWDLAPGTAMQNFSSILSLRWRTWGYGFGISLNEMLSLHFKVGVMCWCQSINNQYCGRAGPCGSYCDCKVAFSNNHQDTLKKKKGLLLSGPGNYVGHLVPHSKVMGAKRERESEWAWSSAFILFWGI